MKVYQVKVCVRGNAAAHQVCLVEAKDYKVALIKSIEKFSQANNFPIEECCVIDIRVVEEIKEEVQSSVPLNTDGAPESIDFTDVNTDRDGKLQLEKWAEDKRTGKLNIMPSETIDILRVDECHKNREIVGDEKK